MHVQAKAMPAFPLSPGSQNPPITSDTLLAMQQNADHSVHGDPDLDELSALGFIKPLVMFNKSTVWRLIAPELLFGLTLTVAIKEMTTLTHFHVPGDIAKLHTFLGGFLGFLLAMRANAAKDAFMDGRAHLGAIANGLRDVLSAIICVDINEASRHVHFKGAKQGKAGAQLAQRANQQFNDAEDIRRHCNILYAFIRQAVRERAHGFAPEFMAHTADHQLRREWAAGQGRAGSSGAAQAAAADAFVKKNFLADPCSPLVAYMLKPNDGGCSS